MTVEKEKFSDSVSSNRRVTRTILNKREMDFAWKKFASGASGGFKGEFNIRSLLIDRRFERN